MSFVFPRRTATTRCRSYCVGGSATVCIRNGTRRRGYNGLCHGYGTTTRLATWSTVCRRSSGRGATFCSSFWTKSGNRCCRSRRASDGNPTSAGTNVRATTATQGTATTRCATPTSSKFAPSAARAAYPSDFASSLFGFFRRTFAVVCKSPTEKLDVSYAVLD